MSDEKVITITPAAQEHFAQIVKDNNALGVRLRLQGGGCAGFSYEWDLVTDITEIKLQEYTEQFEEWQFWLDDVSQVFLEGSVIDKKRTIAGNYIDIYSPKAESSCGCGESISFAL
jgi:iron-sulfur cluster assembly protein